MTNACWETYSALRGRAFILIKYKKIKMICTCANVFAAYKSYMGCLHSMTGWEYIGTRSVSMSGKECLPWVGSDMEETGAFPDHHMSYASSKCRNPDLDPNGPWCYVGNNTREYCKINLCGKNQLHVT